MVIAEFVAISLVSSLLIGANGLFMLSHIARRRAGGRGGYW